MANVIDGDAHLIVDFVRHSSRVRHHVFISSAGIPGVLKVDIIAECGEWLEIPGLPGFGDDFRNQALINASLTNERDLHGDALLVNALRNLSQK
jgi:hypothetical protein